MLHPPQVWLWGVPRALACASGASDGPVTRNPRACGGAYAGRAGRHIVSELAMSHHL